MRISPVYRDQRANDRTPRPWCLTIFTGTISETIRDHEPGPLEALRDKLVAQHTTTTGETA